MSKHNITRVLFTHALNGGMWIERADGHRDWMTFEEITAEVGECEADRLSHIAYANGMMGMWYNAENGRNVYANGLEVN